MPLQSLKYLLSESLEKKFVAPALLLIAKFRLKLKKVGKTTRPFRSDLNQIPYDYTVEVRNRCKGLDLIECLKNYGQRYMTLYRSQGNPQGKEM